MSRIVFPLKAEVRRLWLVDFAAGLLRGFVAVGASGALTVFALLWLRANGYLVHL